MSDLDRLHEIIDTLPPQRVHALLTPESIDHEEFTRRQCSLVQGSDGIVYGSAVAGGIYGGGVYFALDAGKPKPAPRPQRFNPQSGAVGAKVLIWGSNLLSASVRFNGTAATVVSSSGSNYIWATVPPGATTGPVTVTTPGGTYTTKASFVVQ